MIQPWQCADLDYHHGKGIHVRLFRYPDRIRCRFGIPIEYGQPFWSHPPNGSGAVNGRGVCRLRIGSYGRQPEIAQDRILVVVNEDIGLCKHHEERIRTHFVLIAYSFQVTVDHVLRVKVAQATDDIYELRIDTQGQA